MLTRCLTLIETLIALVVIAAIGALVFPALMESLEEQSFESAADVTNEQLMMARAHAQATGSPVEVTYNVKQSKVEARMFSASEPASATFGSMSYDQGGGGETPIGAIEEPWASRILARSVRLSPRPLDPTQSSFIHDEPLPSRLTEEEIWAELGNGQEVRLAVFMPDGSALMGERVWLNDRKGRRGVFTINPWSGLALFERLTNQAEEKARSEKKDASSREGASTR